MSSTVPDNQASELTRAGQAGGLAALTAIAIRLDRPLEPRFQAYAGSMFVTGLVVPPAWFSAVSKKGWERDLTADVRRRRGNRPEDEQRAHFRELNAPFKEVYDALSIDEDRSATAATELTLVDATVLPAIEAHGTKSGGHTLPVLRLPHASVDAWWFVDGEAIKGSSGWSGSFGVLFPIEF